MASTPSVRMSARSSLPPLATPRHREVVVDHGLFPCVRTGWHDTDWDQAFRRSA